ncbi:AcrR family transcriptional regulator [Alkalihalobacillus xiaoxiensis]|uniref:AcrR family transcriptional regulator n=1 Tax=Shouchella xiaoxiensis TaxID=766895 RepID=A0ABS2SWY4_9BACI|nr:TetR/AcrR family transcriptional regulator [Shouchella xiaoxiensis]MBM7840013.1 AcrR family transcriptional regulator [Shouchella xiaoxiensis]
MTPRKSSQQELTKEIILQEADKQFTEQGFSQVSMRKVAKELGCSHGALYYHYTNKAELFYEVVSSYFMKLDSMVDDVRAQDDYPQEGIFNLFRCFLQFGLDHQSQYELMFMVKNTEVDTLTKAAANRSYDKFAQVLFECAPARASISDVYAAFVSLHGFVAHYIGRVKHFSEVEGAAQKHILFLQKPFQAL